MSVHVQEMRLRCTYLEVTSASEESKASANRVRVTQLETVVKAGSLGLVVVRSWDIGVALYVVDDSVCIYHCRAAYIRAAEWRHRCANGVTRGRRWR